MRAVAGGSCGRMALDSKILHARLVDVFAGLICSVLSIAYSLSYAALIFTGPLAHLLSYGIAVTFLSAAVGGAIVALRSSLPFAIAGPDSSGAVVLAALVATTISRLDPGVSADLRGPAVIAMSSATALTGLLMYVLGLTRSGRAIRFVPYPVIGGFLGATGWLMVTGAVQVIAGARPTLGNLATFVDADMAAKIAAGVAVAVVLHVLMRKVKSPFVLPGVLLAAFAAAYLVLFAANTPLTAAQDGGWMFQPQPVAALDFPWKPDVLARFPWLALPSLAADVLAVMFVTICNLLLNTTGIEIATRSEADIERDLKALGLANLATAALGGYVTCTSLSRSILVRSAGSTSRAGGLTVAAVSALALVADPSLLGYLPKFVLGGLLLYLGSDLVYQWFIQSSQRLHTVEYLSLIAIALLIVYFGFIAGVLIGIAIGCATFALSASRVNAIKFKFDGSEYRSSLDRGPRELALLAEHGKEIQGMALQSYLFFGSANRLYQHVKDVLAAQPDCRFLIFDFRLVTGIDSSATHSFAQIERAAAAAGARLVLVDLRVELRRAFRSAGVITGDTVYADDLDRALEFCEQEIIDAHRAEAADARSLRAWLADALGDTAYADLLARYCRPLKFAAGDIVARQGEAANSMHLILEGRLGILVETEDGRRIRVRSLGPHTTIGEMGLITRRPRSATIQAESVSVLYELNVDSYQRLRREQPELAQALLGYIVGVMAERLSFANRLAAVLQR